MNPGGVVLYQGATSAAPKKHKNRLGFNPCLMFVVPQLSALRFTKHCLTQWMI
jgi:hypothetical protein